jgi:hypothetical protein
MHSFVYFDNAVGDPDDFYLFVLLSVNKISKICLVFTPSLFT